MKPTQTGIAVALALVVIGVIFVFPSLSPFNAPVQLEQELATTTNETTSTTMPTETVTQLQVTDTAVGAGATAAKGDSVTVSYVGTFTNGTVFDASANQGSQGFNFVLGAGDVIRGWDDGLVGMRVGGKRRLVIPAALAYGENPIKNPQTGEVVIPANSTLIFDVELLKVEKTKK